MFVKLFLRSLRWALTLIVVSVAVHAQQRDPNQPRATPTPTPTPRPITKSPKGVVKTEQIGTLLSNVPGIYGTIRWRKELGLPYDPAQAPRPPYRVCNIFLFELMMQEPTSPGTFGVTRTAVYRASAELVAGKVAEDGDYYVCTYEITKLNGVALPHNKAMVISPELDDGILRGKEKEPWSVGSNAAPPPGQQRAIIIIGGRTNNGVTLTDNQPHATADFEMVYRPIPSPLK